MCNILMHIHLTSEVSTLGIARGIATLVSTLCVFFSFQGKPESEVKLPFFIQ